MKLLSNEWILLAVLFCGLAVLCYCVFRLLFIQSQESRYRRGGDSNTPLSHFISAKRLLNIQIGIVVAIVVLGLLFIIPLGNVVLIIPLIIVACIGFFLPKEYYRLKINQRNCAFEKGMLDFTLLVSNGLRSGQAFVNALENAAMSSVDCIREEFELALEESRGGRGLSDALRRINGRISSESLELFITVCIANVSTGASLIEVLDIISETIRKEISFKGKLPVMVAGVKMEAKIITFIPFILIVAAWLWDSEIVIPFITEPLGICAGIIAMLIVLGAYVWMSKITDIKI